MVVRGVPHRLMRDGWWLDDEIAPPKWKLGGLLCLCVILADQMMWAAGAGLGFVVWVLGIGLAVHVTLWADVVRARGLRAWAVLVISVIPAIDLVQAASVSIALIGLCGFELYLALGRWDVGVLIHAMMRLPFVGGAQNLRDLRTLGQAAPTKASFRQAVLDWAFPLGAGAVFVALIVYANPVLDQWLMQVSSLDGGLSVNPWRVFFWALVASSVWPLLRLTKIGKALGKQHVLRRVSFQPFWLNPRSVLRALLVFNLIFGAQTLMDIGYLWGGVALPEGMTYANYAHRGAYPLMIAALLAGAFALIAGAFLDKQPHVRSLMYLWVGQCVFLVVSSILRLDLYVDAYGLTRMRFAAIVWMIVVALGLLLIIMQIAGRYHVGWFAARAAGLALLAVYAVSLINVDGVIARHNLGAQKIDSHYLCSLGDGATPALVAAQHPCGFHRRQVSVPEDWREWGYRNARLRRSLTQMENVQ